MKKFVRIMSMVLCVAIAVSLCACGGVVKKPAQNTGDEHIKLVWFIRNSEPEGFDEVLDEANVYLKEKLNITLDLECIEPGDYESRVQLALASNDELDIVWTSGWANKFEPNVAKGAYLPLDEYLELPELEELKKLYDPGVWGAASIGGNIYGVPVEQVLYNQQGYTFIKDISDKYGVSQRIRDLAWVDENNHGTMEEIEEIYDIVREGEPEDFAILTTEVYDAFKPLASTAGGYKIVDDEVVIDTDMGLELAHRAKRWHDKGYFPEDVATMDNGDMYINEGLVYSGYNRYLPGSEGKWRLSKPYDIIHIPTSNKMITRGGVQTTLNAIPITCKDPVRALKLLEFMHKDAYILNLICYGIEGRDYTVDPENPKRMNRESSAYYIPEFLVGSQFLALLSPSYEDGVWEETITENAAADADPYIGFSFDRSAVESEISQCSAVSSEYSKILGFGLEDPETAYFERERKLDLAGRQIVVDEIERQIAEWRAQQEG